MTTATVRHRSGRVRSEAAIRRREFVTACLLATLATMAAPALLSLSGYLLTKAAQAPPILTLTAAIVGVRFFALVRATARYAERLVSHDLALRKLTTTRLWVFERMLDATARPAASTHMLDRLVADTETLQDRIVRVQVPGVALVATTVTGVVITWLILPAAAALLAAGLVLQAILIALIETPAARARAERHARTREDLTGELVAVLDGAAEIVAWGAAPAYTARVHDTGATLDRITRQDARRASAASAASLLGSTLLAVAVLLVAADAAQAGAIAVTMVAALALLALGLAEAVGMLGDILVARNEVRVAVARLDDAAASADHTPRPSTQPPADVRLRARGLTLTFEGREVLRGVDLVVGTGERVAIVGPSGVGKSMLTQIVLGLTRPEEGSVTIGGVDITGLDDAGRSALMCWAAQDPHLFPVSIADNVRIADPDANDDRVEWALRAVGAGPWLDALPDGIHTRVGEFGARCSGGERQRVGLARVALSRAPLAVLDEPASHLPRNEAVDAIRAAVDARPGRGLLLVTHHMDELELVDRTIPLTEPT